MTYTNQHLNRLGISFVTPEAHPLVEMSDDELSDASLAMYADGLDSL
jgi:hypothetical protein